MIKIFISSIMLISMNAFAGQVEVGWRQDGTTGIEVLSAGLLGPGETTLSKCFDDARRLSKLVGENTVAQASCALINDNLGYRVFLRKKSQ